MSNLLHCKTIPDLLSYFNNLNIILKYNGIDKDDLKFNLENTKQVHFKYASIKYPGCYYVYQGIYSFRDYIFYLEVDDLIRVYSLKVQYDEYDKPDFINFSEKDLRYHYSFDKDGFIINYNLDNIIHESNYLSESNLKCAVSVDINPYDEEARAAMSINSKIFKYSFKHEVVLCDVIYPIQLFNSEDIYIKLFTTFKPVYAGKYKTYIGSIPQITGGSINKLVNLRTITMLLYLDGVTTYVNNLNALNELRYILFKYIYKNGHITKKYDYVSFSINHCSNVELNDRLLINKISSHTYKYTFDLPINLSKSLTVEEPTSYSSLKVPKSKKVVELEANLNQWLEKYNLYSNDLRISNYLVEVKGDFLTKVASFLVNYKST